MEQVEHDPAIILGISLNIKGKDGVLTAIDTATKKEPVQVATVNPEFILDALNFPDFKSALEEMPVCTIDGSGAYIALKVGQLVGHNRHETFEQYPGADLIQDLFSMYRDGSKRFYFVGSTDEVLQKAAEKIRTIYPEIQIVVWNSAGKIDVHNLYIPPELIAEITKAKPDILLIGFGAPKQELWMRAAKEVLNVPAMVGIGGALRFYGSKPRAPRLMRTLKLEWLYRTFKEKGHAHRAWRAVVVFPIRVIGWLLAD